MIVSWKWLSDYVALDLTVAAVVERLTMAGLNHESTTPHGDDWAIDLEVTSNRPDCLGHLGVAREVAVLLDRSLKVPEPQLPEGAHEAAQLAQVRVECPELCPRYTARVIRGVQVGPSPQWLRQRLATVGVASVNNVVDVTNYVLMECGQPLHAFDLARLAGRQIVVRLARAGESLEAIDHKTYPLTPGMCLIADRDRPVGLGGVMGGAATEVGPATSEILLEAAEFDPLSIRDTARRLNLHSDSSYRFERGLDPAGVDWASRRAVELILAVAGGEACAGVLDVGRGPRPREPLVLRYAQIRRVLGIEIPRCEVRRILAALGCAPLSDDEERLTVRPPTWRRDLAREIDLLEEVARIHGYEAIPENVAVPMGRSSKRPTDEVMERLRRVMVAAGYDEAMTLSVVPAEWSAAFSPWTDSPPLATVTPILRGADVLRRSLVPSLLSARRTNETLANPPVDLYEVAHVYLPRPGGLPDEALLLGITSAGDFSAVKGLLESLLGALGIDEPLEARATPLALFAGQPAAELLLAGRRLGWVGEVARAALEPLELRGATTVAEIRLAPLVSAARLVPQYRKPPAFPAVVRDVNLIVAEGVAWSELAEAVRAAAGPQLEALEYQETYRSQALAEGTKSFLFRLVFRAADGTLTNIEVDRLRDRIVAACGERCGARLRAT